MSEFEDKLQSILGNPDAMNQIMSIAQSISGSSQNDVAEVPCVSPAPDTADTGNLFSSLGNLDPRLLQIGMRLLSEYNSTDDKKTALLHALQPFIKEERYAKVDQAVQIAKLARVIRVALDTFRKGDHEYV